MNPSGPVERSTRPGRADGPVRPHWQRVLWGAAGFAALATGVVGIFLPLLPTTPFVLLAAFCLSRSSGRAEAWLLNHRRFGPMVRDWRERRAIPLRAKQFAWAMMTVSSVWAWWAMPPYWRWLPGAICLAVGVWMYKLPTRAPAPGPAPAPAGPPAHPPASTPAARPGSPPTP